MKDELLKGELIEYRGDKYCIVILHKEKDQYYVTVARTCGLRLHDEDICDFFVHAHDVKAISDFRGDKRNRIFTTFTIDDPKSFNDIYRVVSTIIEGEIPDGYGY
ncbi:MAG: hypothetical protein K6E74_04480 [Bacilli bacterium]|nr:hypothetical protein [Bacilli bacterium]